MDGETTDAILSRLIDGTLSGISENDIDIASLDGTPYWHIAINSVTS